MNKPKLIVSLEEKVIEEIPIEKEVITIGRRTDNDLCLDNLAISGYHSQISTVLDDCFLEDLNSTNGTFVNSKIIKKHALKDGDIIDIGNHRIKYVNHLATSSANSEFEKTLILTANTERANNLSEDSGINQLEQEINSIEDNILGASDDTECHEKIPEIPEPIDELEDTDFEKAENENSDSITESDNDIDDKEESDFEINSQPASNRTGHIQILNGKNSGKEIALDKSLTTVGKPDVAVVGITKRNDSYFIMHIDGNANTPSKLNGETIQGKAQPLEDHDIIDVAEIKLEFFIE